MSRPGKGCGPQLLAALKALCCDEGDLLAITERPWSSVTFSGHRYQIRLQFTGEESVNVAQAVVELLPEHEFTIPGHVVADAAVVSAGLLLPGPEMTLELEFVVLEDV